MNNHDWQQHTFDGSAVDQSERNDFFEVVPPTPFDFSHGLFLHDQSQVLGNDNDNSQAHHLRPNPFRNHRSSSSGSISSQISGYSGTTNQTQWGSDTDHSDLAVQLSVDPKLFQAKVRTPTPELVKLEVHPVSTPVAAPAATHAKGKKRARIASQKEKEKEKEDKKKISHARKAQQHPEHIPRPRNAFILFRKHVVDSKLIPTSVEIRHQNVSIITAKMWSEASPEQKAHFAELARIEKEEHLIKYPGYRYQPVYRRTNVVRRRVRKDAAEEEKCKSVAQLLMQGKTGEELAEEIKENGTKRAGKHARTPSKKGQANELSKGALRALRAQARQSGSAEGSEMSISRSVSRAVTPEQKMDDEESEDEFESPEPAPLYMPEPVGQPVLVPDQMYGQPHSQPTMSWGYEQPLPQDNYMQGYQYPQHQQMQYEGHMPQQTYQHELLYPQTQQMTYDPLPEFYTHDQALPFSPSTNSFNIHNQPQPQAHPQPGQEIYRGMREGVNDMVFSTFPDGIQSPISAYPQNGGPSRPMSARWGGFEMGMAMSGDGFELGFNEHDLMLNEYGSALAQVDDTSVWQTKS